MNDMAQTIIPKSDQMNADDLIAGPITIKISDVTIRSGQEQPISIHYEGDNGKPYKACKSMCRVMVTAWGADSKAYIGRSMTLYRDPTVKWGGMEVGGIRISHMSDIDSKITMALTMTRANKKPFTVRTLDASGTKAAATQVAGPETAVDGKPGATPETRSHEPATAAAHDDASIVKDIEGWVKRKKFDMAYDLARGIGDAALQTAIVMKIDTAKAYVESRS